MELTVEEIPTTILMGLKINVCTLIDQKKTIQEVVALLSIKENYVIGLDTLHTKGGKPHYHVHFLYTGKLTAIQQMKQRKLKGFGMTCKLGKAKEKDKWEPYAWLGYAVKEELVHKSDDINLVELEKHAHTQLEFKKSKLKYGLKKQK